MTTLDTTPHARAGTHWAAQYIGRPWRLGADGPDAFDCWGLVRHVQRAHFGRVVPPLRISGVPTADQVETIDALMRGGEWRRVSLATEGDVIQMTGSRGPHIGIVVVPAARQIGLLHAVGLREPDGRDTGSVIFTALDRLGALGYGRFVAWRHADAR